MFNSKFIYVMEKLARYSSFEKLKAANETATKPTKESNKGLLEFEHLFRLLGKLNR